MLFKQIHGAKVLLDRDLLVQRLEALLAARFEAHVDEVQPGVAHRDEQLAIDCVGAAVDLPDDFARQPCRCSSSTNSLRPSAPHRTEQRKVIVLEQEDAVSVVPRAAHRISCTTAAGLRVRTILPGAAR